MGQFQHDAFEGKSDPRMTNSQRLAQVREHLLGWLDQQPQDDQDGSVAVDGSPITSESVLIVDGFYCGRRFNAGTYRATWFIEEDELKIHDESGKLLCVVGGTELDAIAPSACRPMGRLPKTGPLCERSSPCRTWIKTPTAKATKTRFAARHKVVSSQ